MRKDKLVVGLLLIFFGLLFLLVNTNVLQWSDIRSIWRLWPLLIILVGIDIMFREKDILRDILILSLLFGTLIIWLMIKIIQPSDLKRTSFMKGNSSFLEYEIEEDEINFDAELFGNVTIYPTNQKKLIVKTELPKKIEDELKIEKKGNSYTLKIPSIKTLKSIKKDSARIEIGLPIDTKLNLDLSGGAVKGNFNFGDILLKKLNLSFGAGAINIEFPVQNKIILEDFKISSGASLLTIDKIGNANFDKCEISSGASSIDVDLGGNWRNNALLEIECGVTNVNLRIPKNAEFTLETEGILNPGIKKMISKNPKFKVVLKGALNNINYTEYE
uniref:LiaI-LiaF-like transmembrane region domain-containing protein n=1 Tax=candidate division WOR-3 bacterium TaxID=2052148 RepID=A0A7C4U827_UNCW3